MVLNRFTGFFFVFYICCVSKYLAAAADKVRLKDVEVLTLYNGKMANGRRSNPVPQLRCVGGTAGCSAFTPNVVQCYNKGWDGYDAQWECKTDMDNKYKFGHIGVSCEGYEYPDDPYILRGSCGLEYSIDLTEEGNQKRRSSGHDGWNNNQRGNHNSYQRSSMSSYGFGDLVMLVIVGGIIYMVYSTCTGNRDQDTTGAVPPPYSEQPGFRSDQTHGTDTPPPPYNTPDEPGFKKEYTQGGSAPPPTYTEEPGFRRESTQGASASSAGATAGTSNSGFWSGAATGGLLGYLFGSRGTGGNRYYPNNGGYGGGWGSPHYNNHNGHDTGAGWFGSNWFGGGNSYGHRPSNRSYGSSSFGGSHSSGWGGSSSSGSRTASGMGGTSRR